ncbi:hypothetical protein LBYS11_16380 [Lysinibacillus sp. YS11]|uniref:hypothetical protein n=1 Tax=Lysinibacillus sp. YS11 TaxID=2072025 RepID=UPI000CA293CB|nr:hypothetical protein [Lysinibacillus sp. YS11]AUS87815.1 hypothetical protein LBYS11_16380 [Lysinibacillus sp. YS11]
MVATIAYKKERTVNTFIKATAVIAFCNVVSLCSPAATPQNVKTSVSESVGKYNSSFDSQMTAHAHIMSSKNQPKFVVSQSPSIVKGMKAMAEKKNIASQSQLASNFSDFREKVINYEREEPSVEINKVRLNVPFREVKRTVVLSSNGIEDNLNYEREEPSFPVNKTRINIPFKAIENVEMGSDLS